MKTASMSLQQLELGQTVKLASLPNMLFKIVALHCDGSYQISAHLDVTTQLSYDHVCREMLSVIEIDVT